MESMPLAVGQALLDFVVASGTKLRSVSDVNRHTTGSTSEVGEAWLGVQAVDTGLVFEYLLGEELAFERDLSERLNLVDVPCTTVWSLKRTNTDTSRAMSGQSLTRKTVEVSPSYSTRHL